MVFQLFFIEKINVTYQEIELRPRNGSELNSHAKVLYIYIYKRAALEGVTFDRQYVELHQTYDVTT